MTLKHIMTLTLISGIGFGSSHDVTLTCSGNHLVERGPAGPQGERGIPGVHGAPGAKGNKGEPGDDSDWMKAVKTLQKRLSDLEAQSQRKDCGYIRLGCWRDCGQNSENCALRTIPTLEGTSSMLDGNYWTRSFALEKCARLAREKGYPAFALQHGGWCASSANILSTYRKYGRQSNCGSDGEGGTSSNEVYQFKSC
ncbi:uncharacterized protein LOC143452496 [Clavelina lepadiformis]|uniref:Uncharacterized protein n=1 Tax=Clavelina lepadiformis TaxID=159417 RepID=A0ABP0FTW5_CLALP